MKFITILSFLFFASSVLSFSFYNNLNKRATHDTYTEECKKEMKNSKDFVECYSTSITMNNYKELCDRSTTERCQKIFKDPSTVLPSCKNDPYAVKVLLSPQAIEYSLHVIPLVCSFDSNGNLCPAAENVINGLIDKIDKDIEKTCKSKKCSDAVKQYSEFIINNSEDLENMEIIKSSKDKNGNNTYSNILNLLNEEKCKAQNEEKDSSDATIVKVTYILSILITLTLIILL